MADVVVRIISRLSGKGFEQATAKSEQLKASLQTVGRRARFVGLAAAAGGVLAVREFANFDKRVREIGTLLDNVTEDSIKQMGNEIKTASVTFGQSLDQMAKARYDIVSAGFTDAAASAELLNSAAKLAVGGVTQVARAGDILTTILNAYSLSAKDSTRVSDVLFTTVRLGKTTIDQLSGALGQVAAIAPTVGVSLEEVGAAMATLTAGGIATDQAATALRATMVQLLKPSDALQARFEEMGYQTGAAAVKALGFTEVLKQTTDGITEAELAARFPNVRAMAAVFPLIGKQAGRFADNILQMQDAAGATEEAFQKMEQGVSQRLAKLGQKFKVAMVGIGEALLPVVDAFADIVTVFGDASPIIQKSVLAIGGLGIAARITAPLINALGVSTRAMLGPLGLLSIAITGLIALYETTESKTQRVKKATDEFRDSIKELTLAQLENELVAVKSRFTELTEEITKGRGVGSDLLDELVAIIDPSIPTGISGLTARTVAQNEELSLLTAKWKALEDQIKSTGKVKVESAISSEGIEELATSVGKANDRMMSLNEWLNKLSPKQVIEVSDEVDNLLKDLQQEKFDIEMKMKFFGANEELQQNLTEVQNQINALEPLVVPLNVQLAGTTLQEQLENIDDWNQQVEELNQESRDRDLENLIESKEAEGKARLDAFDAYTELHNQFLTTSEEQDAAYYERLLALAKQSGMDTVELEKAVRNKINLLTNKSLQYQKRLYEGFISDVAGGFQNVLYGNISDVLNKMLGESKTILGQIVRVFFDAVAKMIARAVSAGIIRSLFGPGLGFLFQRGGEVPDFAQTGKRIQQRTVYAQTGTRGTDIVPALLTPGETVISRQETRRQFPVVQQLLSGQDVGAQPTQIINISPNVSIQGWDGTDILRTVKSREFMEAFATSINQREILLEINNVAAKVTK